MPNYRQKNRSKGNRNRNKNQQKQQSENNQKNQQPQRQCKKNEVQVSNEELQQQPLGSVPIIPATQSSGDDELITARITPPTDAPTLKKSNHCVIPEHSAAANTEKVYEKQTIAEITTDAVPAVSADTDSRDTATKIERSLFHIEDFSPLKAEIYEQNILFLDPNMGSSSSRELLEEPFNTSSQSSKPKVNNEGSEMRAISTTSQQGKVIVHRVIQKDKDSSNKEETEGSSSNSQMDESDPKVIVHAVEYENDNIKPEDKLQTYQPELTTAASNNDKQSKIIVHDIVRDDHHEYKFDGKPIIQQAPKVIVHKIVQQEYRVESPQPILTEKRSDNRIIKKSRSLDDDEEYIALQIQEISDNSSGCETDNPPLVSEAESETELLSALSADEDEDSSKVISVQTLPLNEENGDVSKTTLLNQQENYKQRRAQKRIALETHFLPQFLSPRYLDSIKEENSDVSDTRSETSDMVLSRSASGNFENELDDEHEMKTKKTNAVFPRSNLDFSKKHKHGQLPKAPTLPAIIREEQVTMMVEAKIVEQAPITESCTNWSSGLTPESEAAEIVYINSASSSVSDLLDLDYEESNAAETKRATVDLDTDVMQIFANSSKNNLNSSENSNAVKGNDMKNHRNNQRENTPVNQTSTAEEQPTIRMITTAITKLKKNTNEHAVKQLRSDQNNNSEEFVETNRRNISSALMIGDDINVSSSDRAPENSENSKVSSNQNNLADSLASCTLNADPNAESFSESETLLNLEMNNIHEILNKNENKNKSCVGDALSVSDIDALPTTLHHIVPPPPPAKGDYSIQGTASPSPPPVPPLPQTCAFNQNQNEINEIVTPPLFRIGEPISEHIFKKTADAEQHTPTSTLQQNQHQHLTTTSAFSPNSIQNNSHLVRQESADSHCSDSTSHSQCTAINMASLSNIDWNDFDAESSVSGRNSGALTTDESFAGDHSNLDSSDGGSTVCSSKDKENNESAIKKLRLLCTETLASLPYGEDILEELANVAQNIGEVRAASAQGSTMPYPLPDLPHIADIQVSVDSAAKKPGKVTLTQFPPENWTDKFNSPPPPPVPEPPSTRVLNSWIGLPTESDPKLLVCLSPSQQSYLNANRNLASAINHPDHLLDAHKKFVQRRGYHELTTEQVSAINREKAAEHKIIETAAMMKKLRKSLTPPPPIPPPPVPRKSADTKAKTQQHQINNNSNNFGSTEIRGSPFIKEDENQHRLLEIIHNDSSKEKQNLNQTQATTTSSHENSSRRTTTLCKTSKILENDTAEKQERKEKTLIDSDVIPTTAFNILTKNNEKRMSNIEKSEHFAKSDISNNRSERNVASPFEKETASSLSTISQQQQRQQQPQQQQQANSVASDTFPIKDTQKMHSSGSEFLKSFSSMENTNVFDPNRKRFSNIETSTRTPFCTQILNTQPKRFSAIETSSYETKKKIENGCVVYDSSDSRRESFTDGKEPVNVVPSFDTEAWPTQSKGWPHVKEDDIILQQNKQNSQTNDNWSSVYKQPAAPNVKEIMSALSLNSASASSTVDAAATERKWDLPTQHADHAVFATTTHSHSTKTETEKTEQHENSEKIINRQQEQQKQEQHADFTDSTLNKNITSTYEEFRQRAKAAAEVAETSTTPRTSTTSTLTLNNGHQPNSSIHFDHDKLFKEFDDLSKQLNMELASSKANKEKRLKSESLYDLSRMQTESKTHFEELKKQRHDHMKELEREIERSQQSRSDLMRRQSLPRTFNIPIRVESGNSILKQAPASAPVLETHRIFEIPVKLEADYAVTSPISPAHQKTYNDPTHFRRAESMFDLPYNLSQHSDRQRTLSTGNSGQNYADDWTQYTSDLGSSENITRPFAREVEICYKRCRPNLIRAPRMTLSTNDLSTKGHSYDNYNAYNVRRTHAPMLSQVPQKSKPQYLSCQSMIERNPHPTYISTTSRRGVSPAPPTLPSAPVIPSHSYTRGNQPRERRASLPREIHEQQLKYIASKELELKTEFERLENERHRLVEEIQRAPNLQPHRTTRDLYRPLPKLPTLSEDEAFRQQMAEEWLNKVAEREERRLQKIIKISKIDDEVGRNVQIQQSCPKVDIGDEFLKRVRERRSKLAMPSDSDWESGAESHPIGPGHTSETEEVLPVKVIEGKLETDLRQLPKHLREFAKFSNNEREKFADGHREVHEEEERSHEANDNSVCSAVKKSSVVKSYKVSRHPFGITQSSDTQGTQATPPKTLGVSSSNTEGASKLEAFNFNDDSSMAWNSTTEPSSSPFFASASKFPFPLPTSFGEMFATSPFKSHIYDEFQNYWRNFDTV